MDTPNLNLTLATHAKAEPMTRTMQRTPGAAVRRTLRWGAALALLLALLGGELRPAHAQDMMPAVERGFLPGQEAAFAIEGVMIGGSVISIVGNAVDLARGTPHKGWMWSGYILGFMNTVVSPILMIYGRDPKPALGLGLGAAQGVVGVTNLTLAIVNGVRWHRMRMAEQATPPSEPIPVQVQPDGTPKPATETGSAPGATRLVPKQPTLAERLLVTPVISGDGLGGTVGMVSIQAPF